MVAGLGRFARTGASMGARGGNGGVRVVKETVTETVRVPVGDAAAEKQIAALQRQLQAAQARTQKAVERAEQLANARASARGNTQEAKQAARVQIDQVRAAAQQKLQATRADLTAKWKQCQANWKAHAQKQRAACNERVARARGR